MRLHLPLLLVGLALGLGCGSVLSKSGAGGTGGSGTGGSVGQGGGGGQAGGDAGGGCTACRSGGAAACPAGVSAGAPCLGTLQTCCAGDVELQCGCNTMTCAWSPICGDTGGTGGAGNGGSGGTGACVCPTRSETVCVEDGKTYGNSCEASCAGVAVASHGSCPDGGAGWRTATQILRYRQRLCFSGRGVLWWELCGKDGSGLSTRYRLQHSLRGAGVRVASFATYADFKAALDSAWGYAITAGQAYTAPLWVGEFGTNHTTPDPVWWPWIQQYLTDNDLDWCYWAVNGTEGSGYGRSFGAEETFGVLDTTWTVPASADFLSSLQALAPAVLTRCRSRFVRHLRRAISDESALICRRLPSGTPPMKTDRSLLGVRSSSLLLVMACGACGSSTMGGQTDASSGPVVGTRSTLEFPGSIPAATWSMPTAVGPSMLADTLLHGRRAKVGRERLVFWISDKRRGHLHRCQHVLDQGLHEVDFPRNGRAADPRHRRRASVLWRASEDPLQRVDRQLRHLHQDVELHGRPAGLHGLLRGPDE